jgi:hypothetical protein
MRIIKFYLFGFIVVGCSQSLTTEEKIEYAVNANQKLTLEPVDTISIEIDSLTSNFNPMFRYNEINGELLFSTYNSNAHKLQIYNLDKKRQTKSVQLSEEGPDAISELMGFHIHNFDSIFIFPYHGISFYLIDSTGEIKNKYLIGDPLKLNNKIYETSLEGYFETSFDQDKNLITFGIAPYINRQTSEYYQLPLVANYNLEKEIVEHSYGYPPKSYRGDELYYLHEEIGVTYASDYEIHHFAGSHEFSLYNKNDKTVVKIISSKSQYLPEHLEPILNDGGKLIQLQKQKNYLITNGFYTSMVYDKKNRLTYRFVIHPQNLKGSDGLLNTVMDRPRSVMIFNKEFNIAGEYLFPSTALVEDISFVSGGMLWVNMNHPNNQNNNENEFQFIRYKPRML